jgi:cell division protein FtsN
VQVGSFRTPEQAEQLRSRLVHKGYPARVQASVLPGKGVRYRVRVGNFPERLVADQTAQRLTTQERMSTIVAVEEGK